MHCHPEDLAPEAERGGEFEGGHRERELRRGRERESARESERAREKERERERERVSLLVVIPPTLGNHLSHIIITQSASLFHTGTFQKGSLYVSNKQPLPPLSPTQNEESRAVLAAH